MSASRSVNAHARAFKVRFGKRWVICMVGLFSFPFTSYRQDIIIMHDPGVDDEPEKMPDWSPEQWRGFREGHLHPPTPEQQQRYQEAVDVTNDAALEHALARTLLGPVSAWLYRFNPDSPLPLDVNAALDAYFVRACFQLLEVSRPDLWGNTGPSIQTFHVPVAMRLNVDPFHQRLDDIIATCRERGLEAFRCTTPAPSFDWQHSAEARRVPHGKVLQENLLATVEQALKACEPAKGGLPYTFMVRLTSLDSARLRVTTYTEGTPRETLIGAQISRPLDVAVNIYVLRDVLRQADPGLLRLSADQRSYRHGWTNQTVVVGALSVWQSNSGYTHWHSRFSLFPTDELPMVRREREDASA